MEGSEATAFEWPSAEEKARSVAQAIALREQVKAGGLRFSVYLPPGLAEWVLGLVEKGAFIDPSVSAPLTAYLSDASALGRLFSAVMCRGVGDCDVRADR